MKRARWYYRPQILFSRCCRHGLPDFDDREFNIPRLDIHSYARRSSGLSMALMEMMQRSRRSANLHTSNIYLLFSIPIPKNIYFSGSAETTRIIFHAIEEYYVPAYVKDFCYAR